MPAVVGVDNVRSGGGAPSRSADATPPSVIGATTPGGCGMGGPKLPTVARRRPPLGRASVTVTGASRGVAGKTPAAAAASGLTIGGSTF